MKGLPNAVKRDLKVLKKNSPHEAEVELEYYLERIASEKFKRMQNWISDKGVYGTQYVRQADLDPQYVWGKNKAGKSFAIKNVKEFNLKVGDRIHNKTGLKTTNKRGSTRVEKVVDIYERDFANILNSYSEQVAHIVPTYRQYGRGGAKNPSVSAGRDRSNPVMEGEVSIWAKLRAETNKDFADWAVNAVERQANGWDPIWGQGFLNFSAKLTSNLGLSSPLSGFKNLVLGQAENYTTFGFKTYMEGLGKGLNNYEFWNDYNRKIGGSYSGSYELGKGGGVSTIGITGLMSPTEVWNRHFAVAMGRVAMDKAFRTLQTGQRGLLDFGKKSSYNVMKDVFKFRDKDIKRMLDRGYITNKEYVEASQMAHIITQGAPSLPFIPVWMSRPWIKPLTIFYRIGYRMTDNIYNNVLKPVYKDGNPMPLVRYMVSRNIAGEMIYGATHAMLGEDRRDKFQSIGGRLTDNLLKAEFYGVFTGMLNENASQNGILSEYEPAPIQIGDNIVSNLSSFFKGQKSGKQTMEDMLKDNWVAYNHMTKIKESANNEWDVDERWLNGYRRDYERAREKIYQEIQPLYQPGKQGKPFDEFSYLEQLGKVAPLYRDFKETFIWDDASEFDLARSYYAVTHVNFWKHMMKELSAMGEGQANYSRALRLAQESTMKDMVNIVKKMRPLPQSWHKGKTGSNEYYKFTKVMKTDADRKRVQKMLDHYDGNLLPRFKRAVGKYQDMAPWYNIDFNSFGASGEDIKALKSLFRGQ